MTHDSPAEAPRPVPGPAGSADEPPTRLVRLRWEFAEFYAGLDPGAWYPAESVVQYFRAWLTRHPDRQRRNQPLRGLETAHFEFRGGTPREPPWLPGESTDTRRRLDVG
ncbi:MAG: hypothetical protein ACJ8DJ_10810 [Gemmatimonadales bacterium]|jgi:hypothetical protein